MFQPVLTVGAIESVYRDSADQTMDLWRETQIQNAAAILGNRPKTPFGTGSSSHGQGGDHNNLTLKEQVAARAYPVFNTPVSKATRTLPVSSGGGCHGTRDTRVQAMNRLFLKSQRYSVYYIANPKETSTTKSLEGV